MSSLARYRTIVPAHAAVADDVVLVELGLAAAEHNATLWGHLYTDAMCWFAAHHIEASSQASTGAIVQQRDGDLSRTHASTARGDADDWLRTTAYGQRYLRLRGGSSAGQPRWVGVGL